VNRDAYLQSDPSANLKEETLASVEKRAVKLLHKALGIEVWTQELLLTTLVEDWHLPVNLCASTVWYEAAKVSKYESMPLWREYNSYVKAVKDAAGVVCRGRDVKGRLYVMHNLWKVCGLPGRPQLRIPAYNDGEGTVLEELGDFGGVLRRMGYGA
jgi:hypothetical protein